MGKKDPRVDAYIKKSAPFAQPVLNQLRKVVQAACPEAEETIKWGVPHFMHHGILCAMAGFKAHCMFVGFWRKGTSEKLKAAGVRREEADKLERITSVGDLPKDTILKKLVRHAARVNASGKKSKPRAKPKDKKKLVVPVDLRAALAKNKRARATFDAFSYTNQKEYIEWITGAKQTETRHRRLATAIEWMAEGKPRNWKYINC
jgi:uncharacterized protein YdeI (YjbR/CyaY-like superfamily)